MRSPRRIRARICGSSPGKLSGMIVVIDLPIISSAEYPNRRAAPGFQLTTTASRSMLMIASSEDSTMLASWRCACSPPRCAVMSRSDAIHPPTLPSTSNSGRYALAFRQFLKAADRAVDAAFRILQWRNIHQDRDLRTVGPLDDQFRASDRHAAAQRDGHRAGGERHRQAFRRIAAELAVRLLRVAKL